MVMVMFLGMSLAFGAWSWSIFWFIMFGYAIMIINYQHKEWYSGQSKRKSKVYSRKQKVSKTAECSRSGAIQQSIE